MRNVPNFEDGNVPNFEFGNVPNFEVGNVPNFKLGNCIQSIITRTGLQNFLGLETILGVFPM